jgi:uncharacterized membrane protein YcaP (DUF421 family)
VSKDMFVLQAPLLEKILRTVLVYSLILLLVRLGGKRGLATMNTLDFIVVFLLASVVQNALIGEDNTITGGAIGAVILIGLNRAVRWLIRISPALAWVLEGRPTTVIQHGRVVQRALDKLGVRTSELDHAIRSQHGDDLDEIDHGELTPSGQFVLTLKSGEQSSTKADIAELAERLRHIEDLLAARR